MTSPAPAPPHTEARIPPFAWVAAAAILVARACLLVASVPADRPLTGDEGIYDAVARAVLQDQGYAYRGVPWVWKPPGWPLTLSGIYALFGDGVRSAVAVQCVFDAASALLYGWLATRVFGSRAAGVVCFLVMALWPPFARESRFLQTEPLFTLCVALTAVTFARWWERPAPAWALLAGLAGGMTALVRPTGLLPLGGLMLGALALRLARREDARVPHLVMIVLGAALVLAPWTLRNARAFHAFIPVSTGGGELFYMGSTPETDGRWVAATWSGLETQVVSAEERRLGHRLNPLERDRAFLRAGLANWKARPAASAAIMAKRLYRLCLVPLGSGDRPLLRGGFLLVILLTYALAWPRVVAALRAPTGLANLPALLVIGVGVYALASVVFYTNSRYFEPVRAWILMLDAGTVGVWMSRLGDRAAKRPAHPEPGPEGR